MRRLAPFTTDLPDIVGAINEVGAGRANNVVNVTLRANQATTTVVFENCSASCAPLPVALSANAAAALATMYVSSIQNGQFTITHANNAQTDRNFLFVCAGG
jgi:hypothetical protein